MCVRVSVCVSLLVCVCVSTRERYIPHMLVAYIKVFDSKKTRVIKEIVPASSTLRHWRISD